MSRITIYIYLLLLTLSIVQTSYAQQESKEVIEIMFAKGSSKIDSTFLDNQVTLAKLKKLILELGDNPNSKILCMDIISTASPEGQISINKRILKERAESIYNLLLSYGLSSDANITKHSSDTAWEKLKKLVQENPVPYKWEVIEIIDNTPEETWRRKSPSDRWLTLVDSRNKQLKDLRGGAPYRYMEKHLYPQLRVSTVVTLYYLPEQEEVIDLKEEEIAPQDSIATKPTIAQVVDTVAVESPIETIDSTTMKATEEVDSIPSRRYFPPIAIKTNLLFDAASLINVELEIPIGNHWSIAGEFVFPWWTQDNGKADSKRNRLQIHNINLEGKYWFGDRTNKPQMTGWFAGVYAGAGLYDIEYKAKGYQGEFFIMGGLSGGYAHTINKKGNLRMEYSMGIGYMQTDYRYYESLYDESFDSPENPESPHWHPVRLNTSRFTWIGPTKLKVSLVWMINAKKKK